MPRWLIVVLVVAVVVVPFALFAIGDQEPDGSAPRARTPFGGYER